MPFEHQPIDWQSCGKDPAYLAINPAGSVPCLQEDGFVLSESLAINLYLARKHQFIWPKDEEGQATAMQWSFWAATSLEEPYVLWALHECWLPVNLRKPEQADKAMEDMRRPLSRLEVALSADSWLVDGRFTVADLNVASVISLLSTAPLPNYPAVSRWLAACVQRPAYKAAAQLP